MNPEPTQSGRPLWRLFGFTLVFIASTAAGIAVVYHQFADRSFAFDTRLLRPGTLISVGLLLCAYFASDGLRLYCTLRALRYRIPLKAVAQLVFVNLFFSNVTPMATGGGFAQVWYLRSQGVPVGRATAATTLRTVIAVAFIFLLTPVFLFNLEVFRSRTLATEVSFALALLALLYLTFFAIVILRTRWLIRILDGILSVLTRLRLLSASRQRRWRYWLRRELLRFSRSFGVYLRGDRRWIALSIGFTAVFLISLFSFPALLIDALGYQVNYLTTCGLLVVTTFIMYFSPTPGASGISESVFGSFFRDILGGEHLLLVIVAWRFLTIYLGMIIGWVLFQRVLILRSRPQR